MNRLFLVSFAVALCFVGGQALNCYECTGVWSLCVTSQKTCAANENCFSGVGKAAGFVDIKMKGCLAVAKCNQTEQVSWPSNSTNLYTMTKTCCATDLCNSALGGPHISSIMTTLAAIASLMTVKFLV